MPSLRRASASSSARRSPYPSPSTSPESSPRTTRAHGRKRSSGTKTSSRRVLADIEWWRVQDGQRTDSDDDDFPARNVRHVERPSTPVSYVIENYPQTPTTPTTPTTPAIDLSTLYVVPYTPTRRPSSLDSSPDDSPRTERSRHGIEDLDLHDEIFTSAIPSPFLPLNPRSLTDTLLSMKETSVPFGGYADFTVSPFSSPFSDLYD